MGRCGCAAECACAVAGEDTETIATSVAGNGSIGAPYVVTSEVILVPDGEGPLGGDDNALKVDALGLYVAPPTIAPSLLAYATGTYVGDGANPKTVATGLTSIVQLTVMQVDATSNDTMFAMVFKAGSKGLFLNYAETPDNLRAVGLGQQVPDISADDGSFLVDDGSSTAASLNFTGRHYEWMAIGTP